MDPFRYLAPLCEAPEDACARRRHRRRQLSRGRDVSPPWRAHEVPKAGSAPHLLRPTGARQAPARSPGTASSPSIPLPILPATAAASAGVCPLVSAPALLPLAPTASQQRLVQGPDVFPVPTVQAQEDVTDNSRSSTW